MKAFIYGGVKYYKQSKLACAYNVYVCMLKNINTAGVGFMSVMVYVYNVYMYIKSKTWEVLDLTSVMVNTLLMTYCTTHFTLPSEIPEINY